MQLSSQHKRLCSLFWCVFSSLPPMLNLVHLHGRHFNKLTAPFNQMVLIHSNSVNSPQNLPVAHPHVLPIYSGLSLMSHWMIVHHNHLHWWVVTSPDFLASAFLVSCLPWILVSGTPLPRLAGLCQWFPVLLCSSLQALSSIGYSDLTVFGSGYLIWVVCSLLLLFGFDPLNLIPTCSMCMYIPYFSNARQKSSNTNIDIWTDSQVFNCY